ncbi:MAG: twin-arginine translocation signal domain-containing protein, partial [Candidatus Poribacteria bacterium]
MTKITYPTSDSVVEQIMADCEQISQELPAISRRHFLKGAIGAGIALGAISPAIAQVRQPPFLAEEFQKPLVPVVEAMSEKVWDGDVL